MDGLTDIPVRTYVKKKTDGRYDFFLLSFVWQLRELYRVSRNSFQKNKIFIKSIIKFIKLKYNKIFFLKINLKNKNHKKLIKIKFKYKNRYK